MSAALRSAVEGFVRLADGERLHSYSREQLVQLMRGNAANFDRLLKASAPAPSSTPRPQVEARG